MCCAGTLNIRDECNLKGECRSRSRPSRPSFLFGLIWTCLLLRTVLQDALSEVMKVYPLLRLKVSVDDATAFMDGRSKELAGIAERVLKTRRTEMKKQCN